MTVIPRLLVLDVSESVPAGLAACTLSLIRDPERRSQELVADLAVHVGAQPAAELVEQLPPVGARAAGLPVQVVLEPQPGHMRTERNRGSVAPAPQPGSQPAC